MGGRVGGRVGVDVQMANMANMEECDEVRGSGIGERPAQVVAQTHFTSASHTRTTPPRPCTAHFPTLHPLTHNTPHTRTLR